MFTSLLPPAETIGFMVDESMKVIREDHETHALLDPQTWRREVAERVIKRLRAEEWAER